MLVISFTSQSHSRGRGFPGSSAGKHSACNAGDPGSIPGLGRAPGEGIGYPIQYFGAFLVAQMVKNPPAMWETWIQFDPWVGKFPWGSDRLPIPAFLDFPCGLAGEESTCNVGDLGSIPGWEDTLEKRTATHSNILAWRLP